MHKAKGLYGGWKITFVVADANNRVTAGIDGVMEMCTGGYRCHRGREESRPYGVGAIGWT